jgi:hypothetical protein
MARSICVDNGDELRLICPECHTTWSTTRVPSECPTCTATVTIRVVRSAARNDNDKRSERVDHE